jgi:hypothetical protein
MTIEHSREVFDVQQLVITSLWGLLFERVTTNVSFSNDLTTTSMCLRLLTRSAIAFLRHTSFHMFNIL